MRVLSPSGCLAYTCTISLQNININRRLPTYLSRFSSDICASNCNTRSITRTSNNRYSTTSLMTYYQTTTGSEMDRELLDINQKLLDSIAAGDYATYDTLCTDDITCIEAESNNQVVAGKPFHKYYFDLPKDTTKTVPVVVSMANPHVRLLADNTVGILSYVRLNQVIDNNGKPVTTQSTETRVWEKRNGKWVHSHFHRSL